MVLIRHFKKIVGLCCLIVINSEIVNTVADDFLPNVFPTEPHKRKRLGLPEEW